MPDEGGNNEGELVPSLGRVTMGELLVFNAATSLRNASKPFGPAEGDRNRLDRLFE